MVMSIQQKGYTYKGFLAAYAATIREENACIGVSFWLVYLLAYS